MFTIGYVHVRKILDRNVQVIAFSLYESIILRLSLTVTSHHVTHARFRNEFYVVSKANPFTQNSQTGVTRLGTTQNPDLERQDEVATGYEGARDHSYGDRVHATAVGIARLCVEAFDGLGTVRGWFNY